MPRRPQPFFRKATGWWMVNLRDASGRRRQKKLAEGQDNRDEAFRKFHEIMARPQPERVKFRPSGDSVHSILDRFLVHAATDVSPATLAWYENFLNDFAGYRAEEWGIDELLVGELKVLHVTEWLDSKTDWSSSTKAGAVCCIRRAFRWATEQGYIDRYPLFGMKAPAKATRETVLTEKQFKKVLAAVKDPGFRDLLEFLRNTGARPQEACRADVRHVELKSRRIVFQRSEAKGKKAPRAIYLNDAALEIVRRHVAGRDEGPLFLNSRRKRWTSNAIRQRFESLEPKLGTRYCAYHFRHTFATRALEKGMDSTTVSTLMGHADASTLARIYQHLAKNPKFLIEAAKKAR